jgi:hypothetical protein
MTVVRIAPLSRDFSRDLLSLSRHTNIIMNTFLQSLLSVIALMISASTEVSALAPNPFSTSLVPRFQQRSKSVSVTKGIPVVVSSTLADQHDDHHRRTPTVRQKWGIDKDHANEYWFDARIHTLGNVGFLGAVHAACAPITTKLIDVLAYDGIDIRQKVSTTLCVCSLGFVRTIACER